MRGNGKENKKACVFIVDDHPILRQGLAQLINHEDDLTICGEAKDVPTALEKIPHAKTDVAIVDLALEGRGGLELIKILHSQYPKLSILVLSMHDEAIYAERALHAGARGYVMKQEVSDVVVHAIRRVLKGEIHVSDRMADRLLKKMAIGGRSLTAGSMVERLSDRELEIFTLIGKGLGTSQIAKKLVLSVKTVEAHREHIKSKLAIRSGMELIRQAVNWSA